MSYILSVVVLEPESSVVTDVQQIKSKQVIVEASRQGADAKWRACYLEGVWRRLREIYSGFGVYLLSDIGGGYLTSSPFVDIPDNNDQPATLSIPPEFRQDISNILEALLALSRIGQILIILEPTYGPTGSVSEERYDGYAVSGPMSLTEFWVNHDNSGFLEETICRISV